MTSRNTSPHYFSESVPTTPVADLAKVRTQAGLEAIVYSMNQTRDPAREPLVRFRACDAWEKERTGMRFFVQVYDLGKDVADDRMACGSITEARGFLLGILSARRFRK